MYVMPGVGSAVAQGEVSTVCLDPAACLDPLKTKGAFVCMHDAKQAFVAAMMRDMEIRAGVFDTMLATYCIDAVNSQAGLEDLARACLETDIPNPSDLLGSGRNARSIAGIDRETLGSYLACHASVLVPLKERLSEQMTRVGVDRIFYDIEIPLTTVLSSLEACGVLVDTVGLGRISSEIDGLLKGMEEKIFALAGGEFNINSPKQLGVILFEKLGLPAVKKTKTGYSTDSKVLESLAPRHDLPALILEYRMFAKLKNTYVDALPSMINPQTGRIHTGAQPPEHPGALRDGPQDPAGLHRARGTPDSERRLLPDRAQDSRPHHPRRHPDGGLYPRPGHSCKDRGRDLRHFPSRGVREPAEDGQDHQLRHHVRHGTAQAFPGAGHTA
jgi:DNA polymerase I-like protein with 3'-5' exonuclease and polymerase domains